MTVWNRSGGAQGTSTASGTGSLSKANCVQIAIDLKFLIEQSRTGADEQTRNRFARTGIVFLALYFEALANALFDKERKEDEWKAELKGIEKKSGMPTPAWKFRGQFYKDHNRLPTEQELDIKGIRDLFLVRNHVFAHPPERTTTQASDESRLTKLPYYKFEKELPHFYADFGTNHFEILLSEVRTFLKSYADLMMGKLLPWLDEQFRSTDLD